jgi:hypothetical protein
MSGSESIDHQLQPHLASGGSQGVDNPALAVDDADVRVRVDAHPTWEKFDEEDGGASKTEAEKKGSPDTLHGQSNASAQANNAANGGHPHQNNDKLATSNEVNTSSQTKKRLERPVIYHVGSGETVVVPGVPVISADVDMSGGVIATRHIPERWRDLERPLRARKIKVFKCSCWTLTAFFFLLLFFNMYYFVCFTGNVFRRRPI